ncbi:DUF3313 family protein [Asticcacaulis endophyticus]|uniref:DUF3313 domain-containing protein n=1 Tax=Asticcacaulis endophyticus TaxID=1395890 RepID=A0A918QAM3_9CAUL|nr:DUF3313 family protein [Asticcacaulis endophyticus]GGZ37951.1 hypothetical protein GCM10011273_25560 [Asticcacaulis endophyticus]
MLSHCKPAVILMCVIGLSGCTSAPDISHSTLSSLEGFSDQKTGRARFKAKRDVSSLNEVKRIYLHPAKLTTGEHTRYVLTDKEKRVVLGEIEAQLCFELSERYEIMTTQTESDAEIHSAVTWFEPTGAAASGVAAVAGQFIPGPIGLRLPGSLGGLGAEAEMIRDDQQVAAIIWARRAQTVGTDTPSLSRLGDALQFAEPFADEAARIMSPEPAPAKRTYSRDTDPCLKHGSRVDAGGIAARIVTGLYAPTDRDADSEP